MFAEPYMQRALLAALLLAPLCALLGVFVTARRMAFFSDTVSHAALAGVALGFWLELAEPAVPMLLVALAVALAVLWLKENTELVTDTILALLLSGSVAVGIILLSLLKASRGDIHRFLFGDILAVGRVELWLALALFVVVGIGVCAQLSALTLLTAQEEMAHVCGVRVRRLNYLFVLALTVTVALSLRLLGIILVTSLLVIPPAAARNVSRSLRQQIILSLGCALVGTIGGIVLSYQLDVPCGPAIVVAAIGAFLVTLLARARRR
jgi:ABC-type Mn2+/Zn2+ transport system permease subunit